MRALFIALLFAATFASEQPETLIHGSRGSAGSSSCASGCVARGVLHTMSGLTRAPYRLHEHRSSSSAAASGCHAVEPLGDGAVQVPPRRAADLQCTSAEGCDPPSHASAAQAEGGCDAAGHLLASRAATFWQFNVDGLPGLTDVVLLQGRVYAVMNLKLANRNGFTHPGVSTDAPPWHAASWTFSFEGFAAPVAATTFGADTHNHTLIVYAMAPAELLQEAAALRRVTIEGLLPGSLPLLFVSVPFCVRHVAPRFELAVCTQLNQSAVHLVPEWLTYHHQLQGFEHFFIYVNENPAAVRPLLRPFVDAGLVTVVDWQWAPRYAGLLVYQQAEENSCLLRARGVARWVALHDVDEFFVPRKPGVTFRALLSQVGPEIGALQAHTQWFGPHTDVALQEHLDASSRFVTARVVAAGEVVLGARQKCVVRPEEIFYHDIHNVAVGAEMHAVNDNVLRLAHYKYGGSAQRFNVLDYTARDAALNLPALVAAYDFDPLLRPPLPPAGFDGLLSGRMRGGLGEQLFIAARVHSLAAHTGRMAVLDFADRSAWAGDTIFSLYARTDVASDLTVVETDEFVAVEPPALPISARHVQLDGYWQHESNIRPDYVATLALPTVPPRPHTAFVHVRRGDYVDSHMHDVGLVASGYYAAAMALLREKAADPLLRFLVFSNDLEWCRQSPLFAGVDVDFFDDGGDAVLSMMTMAACTLGGVAANSSFSWWAAFLNSSPFKKVVFPFRWLTSAGAVDIWINGSYVVHPDGRVQLVRRP